MKNDTSASMENSGKPTGRTVKNVKAKTVAITSTKPNRFPKKVTSGTKKVTGRAMVRGKGDAKLALK